MSIIQSIKTGHTMKYLQEVSIFFWSANHIAMEMKQSDYTYTSKGKFKPKLDQNKKLILNNIFRSLTHDGESKEACSSIAVPSSLRSLINDISDNTSAKPIALIEEYREDCSQYIRADQIDLLKDLYQLLIDFYALDDDEDFGDTYDDDELPDEIKKLESAGIEYKTGKEKRNDALINASKHELLQPLVDNLRMEAHTPLERKKILLEFIDSLENKKGLSIDLSDDANEETMFGKLPAKKWTLPLGNSLNDNKANRDVLLNLNLFGLHAIGIESGIKKFDDPNAILHEKYKHQYYKFYSRYHNCSGYARFLLEQGGITSFCSTNELEHFGITDPQKYDQFMGHVDKKISEINTLSRELMVDSLIAPKPLESIDKNYLANFKKGDKEYSKLPPIIGTLLDSYNKQLVDVSYEYKIQLLMLLVTNIHEQKVHNPLLIDALQKEIRRNYSIDFDAQFSYNHYFQLEMLAACALISTSVLAVSLIATVFPALIPITFAAAVTTAAISVAPAIISLIEFGIYAQPKIPKAPHKQKANENADEKIKQDLIIPSPTLTPC